MPKYPIKAISFNWNRTLFDPEIGMVFSESKWVLDECLRRDYRLAVVSYASQNTLEAQEARRAQIEQSPLRKYFEFVIVAAGNKDEAFEELVTAFGLNSEEILIVDDRTKGLAYGNHHGHPTIWLRKGEFADELPKEKTGFPSHIIHELEELLDYV